MKILALLIMLVLGACSSSPTPCPEGKAGSLLCNLAQKAGKGDDANLQEEQCINLGFKPGTEAFANCRLKMLEMAHKEAVMQSSERPRTSKKRCQLDDSGDLMCD